MASDQYDKDTMIEAILAANGKVTLAAKKLKCTRDTIYRYAKRYVSVQSAIDGSRADFDETILDVAEWKLRDAVLAGEQWAVKYVLDKKGHVRGYVDRLEQTGANGGAIKHDITSRQLPPLPDDTLDEIIHDSD